MARRILPRALLALVAAGLAAAPAGADTATKPTAKPDYAAIAGKGVADSRRRWWNLNTQWYTDHLHGPAGDVGTVWGVVHVFDSVSALAIAKPSRKRRLAVRKFAAVMEQYWSRNVHPHGAYTAQLVGPGGDGPNYAFYDDNGWLGLAFVDAYRATKNRRYLRDAARALRFIDEDGWDGDRGVLWNQWDSRTSLASYASATALAAELYHYTESPRYRRIARRYLAWGERRARKRSGIYATPDNPAISYVEGAMIGAHLALCREGRRDSCLQAERVARATYRRFGKPRRYNAPQFDAILFRYLLRLGDYDGKARWHRWVRSAAADALRNARDHGLFLRYWDGSAITEHGHGEGQFTYGRLCTHAGAVSVFAWLTAIPPP
ncbi:MAG TPA: glycoside hydrolase family 76 protein [Thermoleophilaceae bacterium]|nr:glycoside hydrolase family 76 protein [Thermoleophilaceae bacterium]